MYGLAKDLVCVPSYIRKKLLQLRTRLVDSIESNLKFCQLFTITMQTEFVVCYKDSLKKKICSDIVSRHTFNNYKVTYYVKTHRRFFTRAAEHMDISNLTGKCPKSVKQSAVFDHVLECNC